VFDSSVGIPLLYRVFYSRKFLVKFIISVRLIVRFYIVVFVIYLSVYLERIYSSRIKKTHKSKYQSLLIYTIQNVTCSIASCLDHFLVATLWTWRLAKSVVTYRIKNFHYMSIVYNTKSTFMGIDLLVFPCRLENYSQEQYLEYSRIVYLYNMGLRKITHCCIYVYLQLQRMGCSAASSFIKFLLYIEQL
jgi:hypothetical protein